MFVRLDALSLLLMVTWQFEQVTSRLGKARGSTTAELHALYLPIAFKNSSSVSQSGKKVRGKGL